jgi:DnaJ-class molecular chaperone
MEDVIIEAGSLPMEWLAKHPLFVIASLLSALITIWSVIKESPFWIIVGSAGFILTVVAPLVSRRYRSRGTTSVSTPANGAIEKRRMTCRYCGGTGKVLTYQDRFQTQYGVCGICGGHGDFLTTLWSQPDCKYCGGSGRVVTNATRYQTSTATCGICGGTGKRPFDS